MDQTVNIRFVLHVLAMAASENPNIWLALDALTIDTHISDK